MSGQNMNSRLGRTFAKIVFIGLVFGAATGCATTYRRTKEDAEMIRDAAHMSRPSNKVWLGPIVGPAWVFVGILHLPLSVVRDTFTFPFDVQKPKPPNQAPEP